MPDIKPAFIKVQAGQAYGNTVSCRTCGPLAHEDRLAWKEACDIRDEHNVWHEKNSMPDSKGPVAVGYMVFERRPSPRVEMEWVYDPASSFYPDLPAATDAMRMWRTGGLVRPDQSLHLVQLLAMPVDLTDEPSTGPDSAPIAQHGEGEDG